MGENEGGWKFLFARLFLSPFDCVKIADDTGPTQLYLSYFFQKIVTEWTLFMKQNAWFNEK